MWLSLVNSLNSILIAAISQAIAAILYGNAKLIEGIAAFRGETGGSEFVSRQNVAQSAVAYV